tara:strand:- start:2721 stop:3647 length:927 start_codon:yes stop_codon:yes gene_type:complete
MNFLYCIDSNYNLQCYISICSLLKHSDEDLIIHIIHKDQESFNPFYSKLKDSYKNIEINLYEFNNKNLNFPELLQQFENTHLTETTYYRLYISEYLDASIENLLYLDADVYAVNPFKENIRNTFKELNNSNLVIGAYDVVNYNKNTNYKPYFNVGVLFIDFKKWRKQKITEKLISEFNKNPNLKYHDQDIMNNYFNNNFLNIDDYLNLHINLDDETIKTYKEKLSKKAIFVHYVGSQKPWQPSGMLSLNSYFYHDLIKEFNDGNLNLGQKNIFKVVKFVLLNFKKIIFNRESIYYIKNLFLQLKSNNL